MSDVYIRLSDDELGEAAYIAGARVDNIFSFVAAESCIEKAQAASRRGEDFVALENYLGAIDACRSRDVEVFGRHSRKILDAAVSAVDEILAKCATEHETGGYSGGKGC
jgi:hypothetical protein